MDHSVLFRIIAASAFVLMAITGFSFRVKARQAGDDTSWKEEGAFIMIGLRLAGFGTWLLLVTAIGFPSLLSWSFVSIPFWFHWMGLGLLLCATCLLLFLFRAIGKNITDTVGIKKDHELITTGPYRYIRHPLYSASVLVFFGFGLLLGNWLIPATGSLAFVIILMRLAQEEANLIETFGDRYQQYMENTPRFFPKLSKLF